MIRRQSIRAALLFGTRFAETILASGRVRAQSKAGHMKASDLINHYANPTQGPGCPYTDHEGAACIHAEALDVARRAIRYATLASDQDRRPYRRDKDDDGSSPAYIVPRANDHAGSARTYSTPRHLNGGACAVERQL